jgi:type II secretory pathway component PulF
MPEFAYIARDQSGIRVTGSLSAQSERDVVNTLTGRNLFPVSVSESVAPKQFSFSFGRVGAQTMANFYSQLASLLKSGVPLLRSLSILAEQSTAAKLKGVINDVSSKIEDGESIGDAFARHPSVFSEMAINMSRAGAEGGFLEDALSRVASFTEQQADLKARTVGALIYPAVLAGIGTIIVTVLLIFFVPKFGELFDTLREKGELPMLTDLLLNFSNGLVNWGLLILLGITILIAVIVVQLKTEAGRRFSDKLKLKMPMFGSIFRNLAVARFCRVLGTLLKNGVPILKALEISADAAGNRILSDAINEASENVTSGAALADPLKKSKQFPVTVTEMIAVAEESNTLDEVLVHVADGLEVQTARRLDLLVRMLEPFMLLIMAGVVLVVVMALLMPIMQMGTALQ